MSRLRPRTALLILLGLWLATVIAAPLIGSQPISIADVLRGDPTAGSIFWQIRLPRILLSILGGAALAVSGLGFQTLFRNSLAEPYTLGVSSGAALGAVLALRIEGGQFLGLPLVALASFAGALGATALIVGLALRRQGVETPTLLLAGVAVSLSCSAIILFLQYLADSTQTFRMVRWMMGGLSVVGYTEVLWLAPWVILGSAALFALRWELNLLLTGEELAASRGVDLARLRRQTLLATSLMIGALVAVAGPIGFVGLIVPHILRRFVGHDHLFLVPACILGGGAFLTLCDAGARTLMAPAELPVGILTALLGGPFFLWLLVWQRRD
ncbi:MAG: FecCD family ABC transporter permease [Thermoanaerobaculia bacterium]